MDERDGIELLRTKLHRPPVAADVVVCPQLLDTLDRGRGLAPSLVCTPAGYGKSTPLGG